MSSKRKSSFPDLLMTQRKGSDVPFGLRTDKLYEGVDFTTIRAAEETINELKKKMVLPQDYTIHHPIQLLPERVIDTTNRNTVMWAEMDGFDPEGFASGDPLRKDIFYMNPFITCSWCNAVNYVDVVVIRRMLTLPPEVRANMANEALPPCQGCHRGDGFGVGAHDFEQQIKQREIEYQERLKREDAAALVIQRSYRVHLRCMFAKAFRQRIIAHRLYMHRAATLMQTIVRMRLARRILKTERLLLIIKEAHPVLLKRALLHSSTRKRVFWYKTKLEEQLLYADYVNLASRTGFQPARLIVEQNIAEIAKRIRQRQNELITTVQKRWLGIMTRRIVKLFHIETIRLRQYQVAHIMKIQRVYRGHYVRLHLPKYKQELFREAMMDRYLESQQKRRNKQDYAFMRDKVMNAYKHECSEERTARFTSKIELAKYNEGKKLKTFAQSVYSDDVTQKSMESLISHTTQDFADKAYAVEMERQRKHFIRSRLHESGPVHYGRRHLSKSSAEYKKVENSSIGFSQTAPVLDEEENHKPSLIRASTVELDAAVGRTIWGVASEGKGQSSRSKNMHVLFAQELNTLVQHDIERATHDFNKKGLIHRFREHNTGGMRKEYKYPKGINESPMKWLDEDIDILVKFQDKNRKKVS